MQSAQDQNEQELGVHPTLTEQGWIEVKHRQSKQPNQSQRRIEDNLAQAIGRLLHRVEKRFARLRLNLMKFVARVDEQSCHQGNDKNNVGRFHPKIHAHILSPCPNQFDHALDMGNGSLWPHAMAEIENMGAPFVSLQQFSNARIHSFAAGD